MPTRSVAGRLRFVTVPSCDHALPSVPANPVNELPVRRKRSHRFGYVFGNAPLGAGDAPTVSRYSKKQPLIVGVANAPVKRLALPTVSRAISPAFVHASARVSDCRRTFTSKSPV